ncbi:MAG: MMPL family transporter, partial [Steroidobacterales bacterium]
MICSRARLGVGLWLLAVAAAAVVGARARYSADLSAFLPRAPDATQELLIEQLRDGLASRLLLIGIEAGEAGAPLSKELARRLRLDRQFVAVNNGEATQSERDRDFLFAHRYLLSSAVTPQHFSVEGLRAAVEEQLALLSSPAGLLAKSLVTRDPTGELLEVLNQLETGSHPSSRDGVWVSKEGRRAVLLARTRAMGSDTDAQARALAAIRAAFTAARGIAHGAAAQLVVTGPGVFAVDARATIEREAVRLSLLSTAAIIALLLLVYRSLPVLAFGLLPVASGALAGVAAVALGFGVVHGITLGFGITLIGEAVDYSIYLFIQSAGAQSRGPEVTALWPTIRLGVMTSVCGFAALLFSAFPGLAQLGLYSIAGLLTAAAVTRYVLPPLLPRRVRLRDLRPLGRSAARLLQRSGRARALLLLLALAAAAVLYLHRETLWNRELSALSPVSPRAQMQDAILRADLGAPDVTTLVVVSGSDLESTLRATERVSAKLDSLTSAGVIGGYESPSQYLPSQSTQRQRMASLPEATALRTRLALATAASPLRAQRLEPFVEDVAAARSAAPLTRADLDGTSLALGLDALLIHADTGWNALLPLQAPGAAEDIDLERVRTGLRDTAGDPALVLNTKQATDALYAGYLREALRLSGVGMLAIALLLAIALRSPVRLLRVIAPLVLAVTVTAAGLVLGGQQLTILHLIGMLLIVAVGSNYALFFDRRSTAAGQEMSPLTLASLIVANAATVIGFGTLAFSRVPVLQALGST